MQSIEEFEVPEILPISDIGYLSSLYKEVKKAYLVKAIWLNLLDADQLLIDN